MYIFATNRFLISFFSDSAGAFATYHCRNIFVINMTNMNEREKLMCNAHTVLMYLCENFGVKM